MGLTPSREPMLGFELDCAEKRFLGEMVLVLVLVLVD